MSRGFSPTLRANTPSPLTVPQVDADFLGVAATANAAARTYFAANQAAMLALAPTPQAGDFCLRSDNQATFVFNGSDPTLIGNWFSTNLTLPRQTAAYTTGVLAAGATESVGTLALKKTSDLLVIATNYPAWVRVYGTAAQRTADASRSITVDPAPGAGVFADVATTSAVPSIHMSPVPIFVNGDTPAVDVSYLAITNNNSVALAITCTITYLPMEM